MTTNGSLQPRVVLISEKQFTHEAYNTVYDNYCTERLRRVPVHTQPPLCDCPGFSSSQQVRIFHLPHKRHDWIEQNKLESHPDEKQATCFMGEVSISSISKDITSIEPSSAHSGEVEVVSYITY